MALVGAHVETLDPLKGAGAVGADCVQTFISDPQGWKKPDPHPDAEEIRASPMPFYVHAPYLINVCSPRNNVRFGSRKILQQTCDAAAELDAAAVIVHAGHAEDDLAEGFRRWIGTLERLKSDVPVLIENTAGGTNAVGRRLDALAQLWEAVKKADTSVQIGLCFDTCHAHAAGEDLSDVVERVLGICGAIDLVHVNDSKDPAGSGRDRHQNLGAGTIGTDVLRDMIRACKSPAYVVETPRDNTALAADVTFVRDALGA